MRLAPRASIASRTPANAGGLISYSGSANGLVSTGRQLFGPHSQGPAILPVQQSTKVELIVNLRTAKAIGLEVPPTLLARADDVIEYVSAPFCTA